MFSFDRSVNTGACKVGLYVTEKNWGRGCADTASIGSQAHMKISEQPMRDKRGALDYDRYELRTHKRANR